jgi:hypothetical protein
MNDFVNIDIVKNRYSICHSCENFLNFTKECLINKEFLDKYIIREGSKCPIQKWS